MWREKGKHAEVTGYKGTSILQRPLQHSSFFERKPPFAIERQHNIRPRQISSPFPLPIVLENTHSRLSRIGSGENRTYTYKLPFWKNKPEADSYAIFNLKGSKTTGFQLFLNMSSYNEHPCTQRVGLTRSRPNEESA